MKNADSSSWTPVIQILIIQFFNLSPQLKPNPIPLPDHRSFQYFQSFSHLLTGAEYGAEASRAVWRVALDYLLFPSEAGDAVAFLDPVAAHLESWVEKSLVVQKVYIPWGSFWKEENI